MQMKLSYETPVTSDNSTSGADGAGALCHGGKEMGIGVNSNGTVSLKERLAEEGILCSASRSACCPSSIVVFDKDGNYTPTHSMFAGGSAVIRDELTAGNSSSSKSDSAFSFLTDPLKGAATKSSLLKVESTLSENDENVAPLKAQLTAEDDPSSSVVGSVNNQDQTASDRSDEESRSESRTQVQQPRPASVDHDHQLHEELGLSTGDHNSSVEEASPSSPPVQYSGSLSVRSDSTTSVRSFAFPRLQSHWKGSPVKMAKADHRRRFFGGGKCGILRSRLLCCKF